MRILFVAIANNVHGARWINQIAGQGWDLHVFPCREGVLHPKFRNATTSDPAEIAAAEHLKYSTIQSQVVAMYEAAAVERYTPLDIKGHF